MRGRERGDVRKREGITCFPLPFPCAAIKGGKGKKKKKRGGKGSKGEQRGGKGSKGEERGGKGRKGEERGGKGRKEPSIIPGVSRSWIRAP